MTDSSTLALILAVGAALYMGAGVYVCREAWRSVAVRRQGRSRVAWQGVVAVVAFVFGALWPAVLVFILVWKGGRSDKDT